MLCSNCHSDYVEGEIYCQSCGAELPEVEPSKSIVPVGANLPAILHNAQLPRKVAAGVGALAVGVGLELLRRNLLARLTQSAPRSVEHALPALSSVRDMLHPQDEKPLKPPKGYEVHETVVYMRRVIRRSH